MLSKFVVGKTLLKVDVRTSGVMTKNVYIIVTVNVVLETHVMELKFKKCRAKILSLKTELLFAKIVTKK